MDEQDRYKDAMTPRGVCMEQGPLGFPHLWCLQSHNGRDKQPHPANMNNRGADWSLQTKKYVCLCVCVGLWGSL